jgi:hypothetical protein
MDKPLNNKEFFLTSFQLIESELQAVKKFKICKYVSLIYIKLNKHWRYIIIELIQYKFSILYFVFEHVYIIN